MIFVAQKQIKNSEKKNKFAKFAVEFELQKLGKVKEVIFLFCWQRAIPLRALFSYRKLSVCLIKMCHSPTCHMEWKKGKSKTKTK
jgi:hypothetical protein